MKINKKIVGITGKFGSGKTSIAEYISKVSGFKLVKFDYILCQIFNMPIIKRMVETRIKGKIPLPEPDIQLFSCCVNIEKTFTKFEQFILHYLSNRKLKKIIRETKENLIIDYVALPMLSIAKKFSANYLIESEHNLRLQRIANREKLNFEDVEKADKIMNIVSFDKLTYDGVFYNNYTELPKGVKELAEKLSSM